MRGIGFGTSMPTAALPGMGATMRSEGARIASAKSSARAAMRPTFTPGPGATSYCVTTGPTVRPAIEPSDRKSTRLNSSHGYISYAVFCLKKKKKKKKNYDDHMSHDIYIAL